MNISNYITEFEHLYNKIKNFNMVLPDGEVTATGLEPRTYSHYQMVF